ncbi:DUF3906 family protein [Marininema halotolerans]|uniref:DUF3906 domain-containing protein n=1 Tax=Marininema halotolerans TaxID=1155944 RepID=A0A1I6S2R3_9BACL|nr:DUF3906 family protein [Marininema halotolerans]SFS71196.1 Protein of unknown function [Marininema halotolerans]
MQLYRFEAVIEGEVIHIIIAAQSDEEAFQYVDIELEKHYLRMPEVEELSLYEKRRIQKGGGYVLQGQETFVD